MLKFQESEIKKWANKYDYPREELKLLNLKEEIQQTGFLNIDHLNMIAQWKSPRSAGHINKNDDKFVEEVTAFSFAANEELSRIESLTLLDGIGYPSASVVLHIFQRDPYPIIDFRALWSVGMEVPSQYSFDFWWKYVCCCRILSDANSVDMRTLDKALW